MDNEAPNYASWVPEAGGYVANGKVVSKTPQYDANGRLVAIDANLFNQSKPTTSKAQPQVANTLQGNAGVTTANIAGSGTDVNAPTTQAGSLVSINNNLGKAQDSVLSSPAMRSPSAEEPILSLEDQALKEIQDAKARNDLQGMINGYERLSRATGADYSAEIQNLTTQRQNKIETVDDQYLQRLNEAKSNMDRAKAQGDASGDYAAYNQAKQEYDDLLAEQNAWRNAVGYDNAIKSKYQQEMQDVDLKFKSEWERFYVDITNQLIQALPGILNFQYDPTRDASLRMAQGYVSSSVKEQSLATGTFGSSFMQSAIAKATAELIPTYRKMARDEAVENFNLLQQTATFLMNAEQIQFDMWKDQIQLQWAANDEKRKQIDQAIQNANARGYYTNEEAAIVGVTPGTESQAARERALDRLDEIDREKRQLEQSKALAEFNNELAIKRAKEEAAIKARYATKTASSGTGDEGDYGETPIAPNSGDYTDDEGNWTRDGVRDYFINEITKLTPEEQVDAIDALTDEYLMNEIDRFATNFGKSYGKTEKALTNIDTMLKEFADWAKSAGISDDILVGGTIEEDGKTVQLDGALVRAARHALDKIEYADDNMDFVWGDYFTDNTKSKGNAKSYLVNQMLNSGNSSLVTTGRHFSQYAPNNVQEVTPKTQATIGSSAKKLKDTLTSSDAGKYVKEEVDKAANSTAGKTLQSGANKAANLITDTASAFINSITSAINQGKNLRKGG